MASPSVSLLREAAPQTAVMIVAGPGTARSMRRTAAPRAPDTSIRTKGDSSPCSIRDLRFDELAKQNERLLPSEITRLGRNQIRHAFLYDAQFSPDGDFFQC